MKAEISGETKNLSPSQKALLEKLSAKRSSGSEILSPDIIRAAAEVSAEIESEIGLLIGRDGRLTHLVVGTRDKLYLPDLGRYRLDSARLRRLRFAVFVPHGERILKKHSEQGFVSRNGSGHRAGYATPHASKSVLSPVVQHDLLVDLEKLRFDGLLVVAVGEKGEPGPVTFVSLQTTRHHHGPFSESGGVHRGLKFLHGRDMHALGVDFPQFISELEKNIQATSQRIDQDGKDRALLVGAYVGSEAEARSSMAELEEPARTAGISILDFVVQRRKRLDPKTVIGKGKVEEIVLQSLDLGADLLVFDRELNPGQLRSITNLTDLRVIDRSMLILDIFSQRAKSSEGRLQVELAQLKYSLPRLTETDTGLSRLTGGIGGRGPGETKLEIGRRRARDRIADLEKRIDKLANQRGLRRERRQERGVPVVAIVGYTNAGKSTLLNALTKGDVFVESKLFATLDPSSRRMRFPNEREVVFVDTVGFIRELPKELLAAFRATLEEVQEADILIHLVDATNPELRTQMKVVETTLSELGFDQKPRVLVFNKVDKLSEMEIQALVNVLGGLPISAAKRIGFERLILTLQERLAESFKGSDPGNFIHSQL